MIKTSSGGGLPHQFDSLAATKLTRSQFESINNGPDDSLLFGDLPVDKHRQRRFKNNTTLEDAANQNETIESGSTNHPKKRNEGHNSSQRDKSAPQKAPITDIRKRQSGPLNLEDGVNSRAKG